MWLAVVALGTAVAATSWTESDYCPCRPQHPQTHFCNADFVIVARIQKEIRSRFKRFYQSTVKKILKANNKTQEILESGFIYVPLQFSPCELTLQIEETYLITGHVNEDQEAYVDLCDYKPKWQNVPDPQRRAIRRLYRQGCFCSIEVLNVEGVETDSEVTCRSTVDDCHGTYGVCLPSADDNNRCDWRRISALRMCLYNHNLARGTLPTTTEYSVRP